MLKITSTADWQAVESELRGYLRDINGGADAIRITRGLNQMIEKLGNIEIEQRRLKRRLIAHTEMVDKINTHLLELEKQIVLAKLYK